jgi:hypothetical protein
MDQDRRTMQDRRSVKDRRRLSGLKNFFLRVASRRGSHDRRRQLERRSGWIRVSKWSSAHLSSLKIAKFLKPHNRTQNPGDPNT